MKEFTIGPNDAGQRLDRFLAKAVPLLPASLAQKYIRNRVDKARSRSTGGSGLGLSIVKNLVERNKGQIKLSSVIGSGTTFYITFPIFDIEETGYDES